MSLKKLLVFLINSNHLKVTESLDIAFKLGIAADKSDQNVRGAITLPHSLGKEVAVAVFADGDAATSAKSAGAEHVGMDDLAEQFKKDEVSVDVVIATQAAMKVVGQLGQVLGPKGLMPNPKTGTVTDNVEEAVKNAKSGQVRFRNDKNGIIHGTIGRVGFTKDQLSENLTVLIDELKKLKPAGAKGVYLKSAHISSTFGPGLRINLSSFV
jgi:large subunit ribosomal protein L1